MWKIVLTTQFGTLPIIKYLKSEDSYQTSDKI